MEARLRDATGGIIDLAVLVDGHGGAINYELMTRLGVNIDAVPRDLSWRDLRDFLAYLPPDSALSYDLKPEVWRWAGPLAAMDALADIFDAIQNMTHAYACANSRVKPARPRPYPRPGGSPGDERMGSEPIAVSEFDAWWDSFD